MTKTRKILFGPAMAGALGMAMLSAGAAKAQDYDNFASPPGETVIVHPYGEVQTRMLPPGHNGELYSEKLSISRPVSFADLDLTRVADVRELRARVSDTARDICAELAANDPGQNDADQDRECIRNAVRDAMRDVPDGEG